MQLLHYKLPANAVYSACIHRVNVVQIRKVLEMLGFKIVDVELVVETKADELTQQFQEVRRCPSATPR